MFRYRVTLEGGHDLSSKRQAGAGTVRPNNRPARRDALERSINAVALKSPAIIRSMCKLLNRKTLRACVRSGTGILPVEKRRFEWPWCSHNTWARCPCHDKTASHTRSKRDDEWFYPLQKRKGMRPYYMYPGL